jgi:uncharacterized protein with ParB-like and HNH nuclease domain
MEAKECKVQEILTENKTYIIPPYQRPYSWNPDNAEQLIDDIYQSYYADDEEYFIGSMICINKGKNVYEVVDGQQRLTTLSLIVEQLKALTEVSKIKEDLQQRLLPVDMFSDEPDIPRLTVREKERPLYQHYILQGDTKYKPEKPTDTESLFIENHNIIGQYLENKTQNELKGLVKFILQNVFIVFVQTGDIASSFRLFNVLNNRGMPLSNADLLKNTLFEAISKNKLGSEQVEKAWADIEDVVSVSRLDKFLTLHRISEKKDRDRVLQKGYESFVSSLKDDFNGDAVQMSLMLLGSAKNYNKLVSNEFESIQLKRKISSLSLLSAEEWIPPLMAFLNRMDNVKDLNIDQFDEYVTIFEKVYIHGWMKKQVRSQREMVCYSAFVAINNAHPFEQIIENVLSHADNEGFLSSLDKDLYEPRPNQVNLIKSILLRLDLEQQDESVIKTYTGRITIEHVLPQKMGNEYWFERFSDTEHAEWLHKLGNLTLISGSKNSEAQNSEFGKKKNIYEKLNSKSSFDITRDLCKTSDWNLQSLLERHEILKKKLIDLWLV